MRRFGPRNLFPTKANAVLPTAEATQWGSIRGFALSLCPTSVAQQDRENGQEVRLELPTHWRIFGTQTEFSYKNIVCVFKELLKSVCFTRRRSQVRVLSRPPFLGSPLCWGI